MIYGFQTNTKRKKNPGCLRYNSSAKPWKQKNISQSYFEEIIGGPSLQDVSTSPRREKLVLASINATSSS